MVALSAVGYSDDHGAATHIAENSKVYIEPADGFENDLAAAFVKKHVPLVIVDDAKNADFLVFGVSKTVKAGAVKTIFYTPLPAEHASISVQEPATGQVVYAYSWDEDSARRGPQRAAEGIAKHLKNFIVKK